MVIEVKKTINQVNVVRDDTIAQSTLNANFNANFAAKDSDDLPEGDTNLYDKTVTIAAGTNIDSVEGTYPNFTINATDQAGGGGGSGAEILYNQADVTNVIVDTDYFNYTVPANTLGTNIIRATIHGLIDNQSGSTANATYKVQYGTTVMVQDTGFPLASGDVYPFMLELMLSSDGSGGQFVSGKITIGIDSAAIGDGDLGFDEIRTHSNFHGVSIEDATTNLDFKFTVQPASSSALQHWYNKTQIVEVL